MAVMIWCLIVSMTTLVMAQGFADHNNPVTQNLEQETQSLEQKVPQCPSGWTMFRGECFKLYKEEKSWQESRDVCVSEGGNLAVVPDEETDQFLVKELVSQDAGYDIWLSMNDIKVENTFEWEGSSTNIEFTNWGPEQPNDYYNQDCVSYWKDHPETWADYSCDDKYHFICQKSAK